ncbi:MAG: permease-like cell division protein FtsX [Oligoflexia bacterium]|nr:permease-like cell division protein FtsX [Oligoflexia bacterium]
MSEFSATIWRSWKSHFWTNAATTAVLTLSFALVYGAILFTTNLGRILAVWGDEIQITIYLSDDITQDQIANLEKTISSENGIDKLLYVDKVKAKSSFEKSLSSYGPNFLKSLENDKDNPFPASYMVRLSKNHKSPDRVDELAQQFGRLPGVEDISYGQEWIKNYAILFRIFKMVALACTIVILIGCLFTVSNAIRASLSSRREEIEILELVGATSQTIRRPFLIEGAFQGFVAAFGALILLGLTYNFVYHNLEHILGMSTVISSLTFLSWNTAASSVLLGTLLGAFGSYICVSRLNTGWAAARERKI